MKLDADAVIWSAPERERASRPLLVLLHGSGSHEGDLFQLAPRLPLGPVIASVRAPLPRGDGWSWFPPLVDSAGPAATAVDAATVALLGWLDGLEFTSVSLLGFSQGAVIALQALRARPRLFRAIVALSGFVADGDANSDAKLAELRPPVFWGRGARDAVIPAQLVARTETWLPSHATATTRIYEDLAHSISPDELTDIAHFLTGAL